MRVGAAHIPARRSAIMNFAFQCTCGHVFTRKNICRPSLQPWPCPTRKGRFIGDKHRTHLLEIGEYHQILRHRDVAGHIEDMRSVGAWDGE